MQRIELIERLRRQVYGGFPTDDAVITDNLVNSWMTDGIALAAKQNYKDAIQLDGIGYVNNSFYTTFKGIAVTKDENFLWKITLPQIPVGIGYNEGIADLRFKSIDGQISLDCIPMSTNQQSFSATMRRIPNKVLYYSQGTFLYALSTLLLNQYTASVTMISGGDATDLTSILNIPPDYIPVIVTYIQQQVLLEKNQPQDIAEDGRDNK